jgi:hypothetical protein
MSNRFPPLAAQPRPQTKTRVLTMPDAPSLPWFELLIGFALLVILRAV